MYPRKKSRNGPLVVGTWKSYVPLSTIFSFRLSAISIVEFCDSNLNGSDTPASECSWDTLASECSSRADSVDPYFFTSEMI